MINHWRFLQMFTKQIIFFCVSLLVLSLITFTMSRLAPGDPLMAYYGDRVERMSTAEKEKSRTRLGLNESLTVQYKKWLKNAVTGDFGMSYKYKENVMDVIRVRGINTLILGGGGFILLFMLALLLGSFCAYWENSWIDWLICKVGTITSCIPEFFLSLVLILIFSVYFKVLPSSGAFDLGGIPTISTRIAHLILPMTVVVFSHLWYYAYMVRNKLLEELNQEYVLLASLKGLNRKQCLFKHCIRNIMPMYTTIMAVSIPHILGGTYVIEQVFSYPGIGTLSFESAKYHDYNMLMVLVLITGAIVIMANSLTQILNELIDPRMNENLLNNLGGEQYG